MKNCKENDGTTYLYGLIYDIEQENRFGMASW